MHAPHERSNRHVNKDPPASSCHPCHAREDLGGFLADERDFAAADAALQEGEKVLRDLQAPGGQGPGDNLRNQAISLYEQNRFAEAQTKVDETLKIYRKGFGPHYDQYPTILIIQGLIWNKTGKTKEAETIVRQAVKLRTELLPKGHFWAALADSALGECLTTQGRYAEAEPLLLQSYENLQSSQGANNPRTRLALERLVVLYEKWGRSAAANAFRDKLATTRL